MYAQTSLIAEQMQIIAERLQLWTVIQGSSLHLFLLSQCFSGDL